MIQVKQQLNICTYTYIDEAKIKFLHPNNTVSEVACELGFEYPSYFSRLLRKKEEVQLNTEKNINKMELLKLATEWAKAEVFSTRFII